MDFLWPVGNVFLSPLISCPCRMVGCEPEGPTHQEWQADQPQCPIFLDTRIRLGLGMWYRLRQSNPPGVGI